MVYGGEKPAGADAPVGDQPVLAVLRFGSPAFYPAVRGRATAHELESGPGLANGRPAWFRAETYANESVFDGTCGPPQRQADDGSVSEEYDLYVYGEIEMDGEVRVSRLVYAEVRG